MSFTTADFLIYSQWAAIITVICGALATLGFIFKWGIRFRLVGTTAFMGVLTGGLFTLSLTPLTHTVIPGAIRYSLVYDTGGPQAVIAVTPQITESQLDATLRQAANDLFSYGRIAGEDNQLTVRARTILHPQPGVSQPIVLGQAKRSLASREDDQMVVEIYSESLAQLPKPSEEAESDG